MRILGVDPGSVVTGYGVIDVDGRRLTRITSGIISLRSADAMPVRLERIYAGLDAIIRLTSPEQFSIETAFYGKNVQSTLKLGQVRGVALVLAMHHGLGIREYAPREVKRAVAGTGAASKQQIAYMVAAMLRLEDPFERSDEADALALAICSAVSPPASSQPDKAAQSGRCATWADFIQNNPSRIRQ